MAARWWCSRLLKKLSLSFRTPPTGRREARPDDRLRGDPESRNTGKINAAGFAGCDFSAPRNDLETFSNGESLMAQRTAYIPHGVIPAVLLPFDNDLAIDEASFRRHLRDVAAV